MNYYYISGIMGMKSNGSFSKDKSRWITFDEAFVKRIGDDMPYGATKRGIFINVDKF